MFWLSASLSWAQWGWKSFVSCSATGMEPALSARVRWQFIVWCQWFIHPSILRNCWIAQHIVVPCLSFSDWEIYQNGYSSKPTGTRVEVSPQHRQPERNKWFQLSGRINRVLAYQCIFKMMVYSKVYIFEILQPDFIERIVYNVCRSIMCQVYCILSYHLFMICVCPLIVLFPTEVLVRGAWASGGLGCQWVWHSVSNRHTKRHSEWSGLESWAALQLRRDPLLCRWHHPLSTDRFGFAWVARECRAAYLNFWRGKKAPLYNINFCPIERSFPTHRSLMGESPEAIEGQAKLFRVLIAYARYNPQIGYSQGNGSNALKTP